MLGAFLVFGCGLGALSAVWVFLFFSLLVEFIGCSASVVVVPMTWLSFAFVAWWLVGGSFWWVAIFFIVFFGCCISFGFVLGFLVGSDLLLPPFLYGSSTL